MSKKFQSAICTTLATTESRINERAASLFDSGATVEDVKTYCDLMTHSVDRIKEMLAQDERLLNIGNDIECANLAASCQDYNTCVKHLLECVQLTPNPLYRDTLRLNYYDAILNPNDNHNYKLMKVSLENHAIKLNNGRPLVKETKKEVKTPWYKKWFKSLTWSAT